MAGLQSLHSSHTALLSEEKNRGQETIQHLKIHRALQSSGPHVVLPPTAPGEHTLLCEDQQMGLMRWYSVVPLGIWPCAEILIKRFHKLGQKLKMRKVPLGWAGENVSTPHQQTQASTIFMNNFGLFPSYCVLSQQASGGAPCT